MDTPFALARFREITHPLAGSDGSHARLGLVVGDRIRPLTTDDLGAPDLHAFLAEAPTSWTRLDAVAATDGPWRPLQDVVLTVPVQPRQVVQAGANYREHVIDLVVASARRADPRPIAELRAWAGAMMDERRATGDPFLFLGLPACVVGDDVPLRLPTRGTQHDWELEVAAVIGRPCFRVTRDDALAHVAGYAIVNDVTTRDLAFRTDVPELGIDLFRSKFAPGFLPTGPLLVPAPFVDPTELHIRLELNGEVMQDASTSDLLFDVGDLVAAASRTVPLLPGDLLLTGSPAGNGLHHGRLLRDGDVLTGSVTGLGTQVVRCIETAPAHPRFTNTEVLT